MQSIHALSTACKHTPDWNVREPHNIQKVCDCDVTVSTPSVEVTE